MMGLAGSMKKVSTSVFACQTKKVRRTFQLQVHVIRPSILKLCKSWSDHEVVK